MRLPRIAAYKDVFSQFLRKGLAPEEIAMGIAVGNFVGILPFLGLHTVLGVAFAHVLRLNQIVVFLGAQISNPLSFPFILAISAQIGSLILNGSFLEIKLHGVNIVSHYIVPVLLGSIVLGLSVGSLSYFTALRVIRRLKS